MRGDIVYRVYGVHEGRDEDWFSGAFRTISEAEARVQELAGKDIQGRNWAAQYHNKGFAIREAVVDTDFEIPSRPQPREKYLTEVSPTNRPETWRTTLVKVLRRNTTSVAERVCEYDRNYSMLRTFEPFRQGSREFALISRDYQRTAVLDLASGTVIAEEGDGASSAAGFCPVGFTCRTGGT